MARNTENKAFFYVGIPRDSQTYQALSQESRESGISIAKLLLLRAGDYYKTRGQVVVMPQAGSTQQGNTDEVIQIDEDEFTQADLNADAALDTWG